LAKFSIRSTVIGLPGWLSFSSASRAASASGRCAAPETSNGDAMAAHMTSTAMSSGRPG